MICEVTCDAGESQRLREGLVRLVCDRPEVNMIVTTHAGRELVSWNRPGKVNRVMPLFEFAESEALGIE